MLAPMRALLALTVLPLLGACAAGTPPHVAPPSAVPSSLEPGPSGLEPWPLFGAELGPVQPLPLGALLDASAERAGTTVTVEGTVESVCPKKGCWMVLRDGDRTMRVTFKDYGFFVPMDIAGRRVCCEGVFSVEETPVDEARHYLEDAGRHEEAARITAPVPSFVFEATGVRVEPAR